MSDDKNNKKDNFDLEFLLSEVIVRISAVERILLNKNIITAEDLKLEYSAITKNIVDNINASVSSAETKKEQN